MNSIRWIFICCALTGCVPTQKETTDTVCPPIKTYTKAQEQQVASEMGALPPNSETMQWIIDYIAERDELRACKAAK